MKLNIYIVVVLLLMLNCSKQKDKALSEKVNKFTVSECRDNCSIDSVGIRKNELKEGDLYVRFGYFLNCSWEDAFIEEIEERNDTMIVHVDRPHDVDTTLISKTSSNTDSIENIEIVSVYPITDCDCFFFFDLKIDDVEKQPKVIRVAPRVDRDKFWDQSKKNSPRIRTTEDLFDLNLPPVNIKKLVLNTELFDVTSGITDAKYLDGFCKHEDYHLQRKYNLISKIDYETFSFLKVYVKDDQYKMSRKHAREVFQSIDINYKYIKAWNIFRVNMSLHKLMRYISKENYKRDPGKVTVYSESFISEFFHDDSVVTRIRIERRCED